MIVTEAPTLFPSQLNTLTRIKIMTVTHEKQQRQKQFKARVELRVGVMLASCDMRSSY
jgi:hypothetical protein